MISLPADRIMTFGRDPAECNIVLNDSLVSRLHCQITYIAALEQYRIVDFSRMGHFWVMKQGFRAEKNIM